MKHFYFIFGLLILLQSCYFGAGLVEKQLSDNIHLIAINDLDDAEIIYASDGSSVYYTLIPQTVYSVGYNNDFIIAKIHPKDPAKGVLDNLTYYHIIEVDKVDDYNHDLTPSLTFEQYNSERRRLKIPSKLEFTIDLKRDK
ncbi:hypothetical protein [Mangrovimonas sp. YM274]|uniref:hypothetical protein n=1 Tax=Mangrovimonas sp. YM274 TaxID=3070660 RepID=UPI0027DE1242|nr:hypothetical protein [Mangrovimonas sp. YM274]WMI68209.1 hypothetical protein RBH95_13780 [Mangrovimonas sp. YM274]